MRLGDIMETAVDTIGLEDRAELAWERMRLGRFHHLVVMNDRAVVGVLSDRDLGGARGARLREGRQVADLMTLNVVTATPTTTLREAAKAVQTLVTLRNVWHLWRVTNAVAIASVVYPHFS